MHRFSLNLSFLSGASDVIVVKGNDGKFRSTPFTVRFGVTKVARLRNRVARVLVNEILTDVILKIDKGGICYFETNTVCF